MRNTRKFVFAALGAFLLSSLAVASGPTQPVHRPDEPHFKDRLDEILERLESVEKMLEDPEPTATATFCVNQELKVGLEGDLAAELKAEVDGGIGWAEVASVKLVASPSWPIVLPIILPTLPGLPPVILGAVPIPTEVKVGLGGGMGRATNLCIDIPVKLTSDDKERLLELAQDINVSPLGLEKSKFQRRGGRLVNYAARQVPGIQASQEAEEAFDRADEAFRSLMDDGLKESDDGLGVFRDSNIREFMSTIDMPINVRSLMSDPEQLFDGLPETRDGFDGLDCNSLGVSPAIQARPRMQDICEQLDSLPRFDKLRDALAGLPDEIVDAIAENVSFFVDDVEENRNEKKMRFCNTSIGQRKVFDKYCGR